MRSKFFESQTLFQCIHIHISTLLDSNIRLERECSRNTRYCRGVRAGANKVVFNYEEKCLEDSPGECIDLGEAAAQGEDNPNRTKLWKDSTLMHSANTMMSLIFTISQKSPLHTAPFQLPLFLKIASGLTTRSNAAMLPLVSVGALSAVKSTITGVKYRSMIS